MSLIDSQQAGKVELRKTKRGYALFRDGSPFFVKGAGGFEHLDRLAELGANSVRTWGWEQTEVALPSLRNSGLTLCAGLWLTQPRKGFDYANPEQRKEQFEEIARQVEALKDESCLLLWGLGNELELGHGNDDTVWRAVEELAAYIKSVDSKHPVMTVLASVNVPALRSIDRLCPSLDFVSINSYGDLEGVQEKLVEAGWSRPYLVTEWGGNGHWEVEATEWGAEIEPSSTEKADQIRRRYSVCFDGANGQCLGSYVFLWGAKQERTPTWYGLLTQDQQETEAVETLSALWQGDQSRAGVSPRLKNLQLESREPTQSVTLRPGQSVGARFELDRGQPTLEQVRWFVAPENCEKLLGGDEEDFAGELSLAIAQPKLTEARFLAPIREGAYRLYLEVRGPRNTVATANFPFQVRS